MPGDHYYNYTYHPNYYPYYPIYYRHPCQCCCHNVCPRCNGSGIDQHYYKPWQSIYPSIYRWGAGGTGDSGNTFTINTGNDTATVTTSGSTSNTSCSVVF